MNLKKTRTLQLAALLAVAFAALLALGAVTAGSDSSDAASQEVSITIVDANLTGSVEYSIDGGVTWTNFGSSQWFEEGTLVKLKAVSTTNDLFLWWTGGVKAVGDEYNLTVPSTPITITAKFVDASTTYWTTLLTATTGDGAIQFLIDGTWVDTPSSGLKYPIDNTVTLRPSESGGSKFIWWFGALSGAERERTLVMNEPKSVWAEFYTGTTYTLQATTTGDGTATVQYYQNSGWQDFPAVHSYTITLPENTYIDLRLNISDGLLIGDWTSDNPGVSGASTSQSLTITMNTVLSALVNTGSGTYYFKIYIKDVHGADYGGEVEYTRNGGATWSPWLMSYNAGLGYPQTSANNVLIRPVASSPGIFVWWTGDVSGIDPEQPLSFGSTRTITAVFADSTVNVTATVQKFQGLGTGGTPQYYQNGSWSNFPASNVLKVPSDIGSINVRAVADLGNVFLWWEGAIAGPTNEQTLNVGGSDKSITAWFNRNNPGDNRTIAASVEGSGSISVKNAGMWSGWQDFPSTGSMVVPVDSSTINMEFRAVVGSGVNNHFVWWVGDITGPEVEKTLVINSSKAVKAVFSTEASEIRTSVVGDGKIQFLIDGTWTDAPAVMYVPRSLGNLAVKAVPDGTPGNQFVWWTGSLSGLNPDALLSLAADRSVTAVFSDDTHTVTVDTGEGEIKYVLDGLELSVPASGLNVPHNFTLTLKLVGNSTPLAAWGGDVPASAGNTNPLALLIDDNKHVTTDFTIVQYTITVTVGPYGTASPGETFPADAGSSVVFTFSPDKGYEVSEILLDGASVIDELRMSKYTLGNIAADHTVEIEFGLRTYTVTSYADDGATITPEGSVGVIYLGQATFRFSAKPGQEIKAIVVDGAVRDDLAGADSYTFRGVDANHTIDILTTEKILTLTVEIIGGEGIAEYKVGASGFMKYAGRTVIPYGSNVTVQVEPEDGKEVLRWWAGSVIGTGDTVTISGAEDSIYLIAVVGSPPASVTGPIDISAEWIILAVVAVLAALVLAVGASRYVKARRS
ncbi:MAG: hypothetical protein LBS92_06485 [Candidatus Methanoplasma sp.]|jgi:hypothetical protein|nr:hypothetical protein [Candidatus Methanoplasma sp.]